jgi:hypothetical protein
MRVRIVRMCVLKRLVNMLMRMRFLSFPAVGMLIVALGNGVGETLRLRADLRQGSVV